MVKLNRIYTRTGDDGTTGLVAGVRVSKASIRVEAYGTIDEANAAIGLAVVAVERQGAASAGHTKNLAALLRSLQHDLFDAGADLATPIADTEKPGTALRLIPKQTTRLEQLIDHWNADLAPLTSFVLPGGSEPAAHLHLARTIVRRAERIIVTLRDVEPSQTSEEVLRYCNRLSDLLFVLARAANDGGKGDVLWTPGINRDDDENSE